MDMEKKVRTCDDIVFEEAGITFHKGMIFKVEEVCDRGIILNTMIGERYMIDFDTFENGFEIYMD